MKAEVRPPRGGGWAGRMMATTLSLGRAAASRWRSRARGEPACSGANALWIVRAGPGRMLNDRLAIRPGTARHAHRRPEGTYNVLGRQSTPQTHVSAARPPPAAARAAAAAAVLALSAMRFSPADAVPNYGPGGRVQWSSRLSTTPSAHLKTS